MKAGIIEGLPYSEYEKIDAFSSSRAKLLEECPAILKYHLDNPQEHSDTPALRLGRAVHSAVFERDSFDKEFVAAPKFGRTKVEQESKEKFYEANKNKTILVGDEMEEALGIAAAVLKSTTGSSLLKGILPELTIVWQDKETGVWCKGRIDALNVELGILLDLKTLSDPLNDQSLMKLVYLRKYYRQLAWYAMGLEALGRPVDLSVLIWVQKKLPYPVRFCSLNQTALETGKHEMLSLLREYGDRLKSGEWPSYDGEVTSIGLPAWVKTETIVEERTEEMTHAA
jgi:hypothetical protein